MTATDSFPALGTTALVCVGDPARLADAVAMLRSRLDAVDAACSRFREDSDLMQLNRAGGGSHSVGPLLAEAIGVALDAARMTNGILDPTIASALRATGYDTSFSEISANGPRVGRVAFAGVPGWQMVRLDRDAGTVDLPTGVELDLGATAKALAADRAARDIHDATGTEVLISLGGDIAVAGSPDGGWPILIADDHRAPVDGPGPVVSVTQGGLATSSTTVRQWTVGDEQYHHLIDPRTGTSARSPWRTVSVAAASCVDANTASSTAIILGDAAPAWLTEQGLPARLVANDGTRTYVGGWPEDAS
jgi:thiamine biosynthesis lipoprotein